MKLVNIKIGEGFSDFLHLEAMRGGVPLKAKETAQRPSLKQKAFSFLSSNGIRASAGRRAASSAKRRSHTARARRTNPKSGGVADGIDGRLSRLLQNGKDRRRERDDKA